MQAQLWFRSDSYLDCDQKQDIKFTVSESQPTSGTDHYNYGITDDEEDDASETEDDDEGISSDDDAESSDDDDDKKNVWKKIVLETGF